LDAYFKELVVRSQGSRMHTVAKEPVQFGISIWPAGFGQYAPHPLWTQAYFPHFFCPGWTWMVKCSTQQLKSNGGRQM